MLSYVTDSAAAEGLVRAAFDEPNPRHDEAIVEVRAYSVSRGEVDLIRVRPDGFRPGQEVSGVLVRMADDGSGPPLGFRVVGLAEFGTWSERVAVPSGSLGLVPDQVSWAQACALAGSGLMAHRALESAGDITGRRVLITGATGAVGNVAVQLALRRGADVTALVSGIHRVSAVPDRDAVDVLTDLEAAERPFDLVLDGVGGAVLPAALRRLAPGGLALTYGGVTGEPAPILASDFRNAPGSSLRGFFVWLTDNSTFGRDLTMLAELVGGRSLVPVIGLELDWTRTAHAVRELRARNVIGKAVLHVSEPS